MAFAESFSTLVALFVMFRDERGRGTDATKEEFLAWLEVHKHEELKRLVVENGAIAMQLEKMLEDQHGQVMAQLSELNTITTGIARALSTLSGLAEAVDAAAPQLSEQSISILRQFNESGASKAIELKSNYQTKYRFYGAPGQLVVAEPRFLDDDIRQLSSFGLLLLDFNNGGNAVLTITRAGAALGQQPAPAED